MLHFLFSVLVSLIYFSSSDTAIIVFLAVFGYVLSSIDLIFLFESLIRWLKTRESNKSSLVAPLESTEPDHNSSKADRDEQIDSLFSPKRLVYHVIMLVLTVFCAIFPYSLVSNSSNYSINNVFQTQTVLLYVCIGIFVTSQMLASLQGVYILFGLVRNPFYPINCLSSSSTFKGKRSVNESRFFFTLIKYVRMGLLKLIGPLLLCAVVSLDCAINKTYQSSGLGYWRIICLLRAFRWVSCDINILFLN